MRWFGHSKSSDKKQRLIEEVRAIGSPVEQDDAEEEAPEDGVAQADNNDVDFDVDIIPTGPSAEVELDVNIPAQRVTSGEREMILPKHLQRNLDREILMRRPADSESQLSYLPMNEVLTHSQDESTEVVSAISLSTIGASIEREVEVAKNMKSAPPLEIKATKQKTRKRVPMPIAQWFKKELPKKIIDTLAATYDKIHGVGKPKMPDKSVDDVPVTARRYRRDHPDLLLPGNVPRVGFTACIAAVPAWIKFSLVGAFAASALIGVAVQMEDTMLGQEFYDWQEENFVDWSEEKSVAFIGNSYLYVNDVPRLVEKMSHGRIHQDSCINPSASLGKLLRAGNGMYELWQTDNAMTWKYDTSWSGQDQVYDFGSCTVFQLLEGYDNDLTYMNYNGAYYYEEGMNPCMEDGNYILYHNDKNLKDPQWWDYVVINDQTKRMADSEAREDSVEALKYAYAPMLKQARAKPLLVDTHAYPTEAGGNETYSGRTIPYMQAQIYYGVEEYLMALKYNLPSSQAPKVVPVGMSYLVVWEEDFSLWTKLFMNETLPYSSPHGSYLFANVLYATVYGHLPRRPTSQQQIMNFFSTARYVPDMDEDVDWSDLFPDVEESDYLRLVARRVALQGYIPSSFTNAKAQIVADLHAVECECDEEGDEDGPSEDEEDEENECVCEGEEEDVDMDEQENRRR